MAGKSNAGANGGNLEKLIASTQGLRTHYVKLNKAQRRVLKDVGLTACSTLTGGQPFYALRTEVYGLRSIYGVEWNLDLFAWHPKKMAKGFVMECKWQQVGGSADDKLPFSVLSLDGLKRKCGVHVAALMLDAAGARPCVKDWVEAECMTRGIVYFTRGSEWSAWAGLNL